LREEVGRLRARLAAAGEFPEIIGQSAAIRDVFACLRQVADTDLPILIQGESGTGKELIARAIHNLSGRRDGPFVATNVGALPETLIESEVFGYEKGAFSGSVREKPGWFEMAQGGTLFLDEVGELSLPAQVRLLRVVQDGEVIRVGGERPVHVKVRIVAATHRDLPAMVETQAFREDLYYRLAVFPIVIPPLRDRPSDIRAFAEYFADRAANRFGVRPVAVSEDDVQVLAAYRWPGNVREMAAVMDRAVLIGQGRTLNVLEALGGGPTAAPATPGRAAARDGAPAIDALDTVIKAHIERALEATAGRVDGPYGAARILRINPHTLRARMRKLRIDWRRFRVSPSRSAANA